MLNGLNQGWVFIGTSAQYQT